MIWFLPLLCVWKYPTFSSAFLAKGVKSWIFPKKKLGKVTVKVIIFFTFPVPFVETNVQSTKLWRKTNKCDKKNHKDKTKKPGAYFGKLGLIVSLKLATIHTKIFIHQPRPMIPLIVSDPDLYPIDHVIFFNRMMLSLI